MKEGTAIVIGLALVGLLLQLSIGPLNWALFLWPANGITLIVLTIALLLFYLLRKRVYFFSFMATMQAAIPSIIAAALLTLIMGLTRQVASDKPAGDLIGLSKMLNFWPFILVYFWMTMIIGEVTIKQIAHFSWRRLPVITSHLGLFIALTCATLGNADMQRLKMYCEKGQPEWRGLDAYNNVHELPVAIQLNRFTIDEYPPKLMVIDKTGKPMPYNKPEVLLIDDSFKQGIIAGWTIQIDKKIEDAVPTDLANMIKNMPMQMRGMVRMDSLGMAIKKGGYIKSRQAGAACALSVTARKAGAVKKGWITCGSYLFPLETLKLDNGKSLVMASREPKRYASNVNIYTQDGKNILTEIEVNKPYAVNGWKIYQLSYNEQMGKWSNVSVFELVSDPWLNVVYVGIYLLLIGAVGMFFTAGKRKEN